MDSFNLFIEEMSKLDIDVNEQWIQTDPYFREYEGEKPTGKKRALDISKYSRNSDYEVNVINLKDRAITDLESTIVNEFQLKMNLNRLETIKENYKSNFWPFYQRECKLLREYEFDNSEFLFGLKSFFPNVDYRLNGFIGMDFMSHLQNCMAHRQRCLSNFISRIQDLLGGSKSSNKKENQNKTEIELLVKEHLSFLLEVDPVKRKPILNESDFEYFSNNVIYFFENGYTLPDSIHRIKELNTIKGNIRYALVCLYDQLGKRPRPDSLFQLLINSFISFKNDNPENLKKSAKTKPDYFDQLKK